MLFTPIWLALFSLLPSPTTPTAAQLLAEVAKQYEPPNRFTSKGLQTVTLSEGCELSFRFETASEIKTDRGATQLSDSSPTILFHPSKISPDCLNGVERQGSIATPGWWVDFANIELGLKEITELPSQDIALEEGSVRCAVFKVRYDDYSAKVRNIIGDVRYWIDGKSRLVRRIEFTEGTAVGPRHWVSTITNIESRHEKKISPGSQSVLIGQLAPSFTLKTSDGTAVHSSDFKGRVTVLNFWATWCALCEFEIPDLEKLQSEGSSFTLFGVTDEEPDAVNVWRKSYRRSFETLTSAQDVEKSFLVKSLPTTVVIDRTGVVSAYIKGTCSQSCVEAAVREPQRATP